MSFLSPRLLKGQVFSPTVRRRVWLMEFSGLMYVTNLLKTGGASS
jgi:hypothetical protein